MLPSPTYTPRLHYLQGIVDSAVATDLAGWPMLNQADYVLVGGLVVLFSYVDLNLRRIIEAFDSAGRLGSPWNKNSGKMNAEEVSKAIQSLSCWDESGREALKEVEKLRGLRNLVAHFAIRRFPADEAFIFIAKSARDFKRQFGIEPEPGAVLSVIIEIDQVRTALKCVETAQNWLAVTTPQLEQQLAPR
jgi:hypothetical protein